jgi:hypothetical protein
MNIDPKPSLSPETTSLGAIPSRFRIRNGLSITLIGLLVFLVGARPNIFDLDRSPVVGFVQISVFLIGLATICIGGYICLMAFWQNGDRSIPADIGIRMVTTGYVIAVFCGMADVFGFGTQLRPRVPFFGPWQAFGVQVGEAVIAIGFLLLIPYHRTKKALEK